MKTQHVIACVACATLGAYGFHKLYLRDRHVAKANMELTSLSLTVNQERTAQENALRAPLRPAVTPPTRINMPPASLRTVEDSLESKVLDQAEGTQAPESIYPEYSEIRGQMEVIFDQEHTDPSWASNADTLARERLRATLPPGSDVRSIDCRTSMCRIETSHRAIDDYQKAMHDAFMEPTKRPWNGGIFSSLVSEQPSYLVAVTFLARDGRSISNPLSMDIAPR